MNSLIKAWIRTSSAGSHRNLSIQRCLNIGTIVASLCLLPVLGQVAFWTDSEMSATAAVKDFLNPDHSYWVKPLFSFTLKGLFALAHYLDSWPMTVGRSAYSLLAVASAMLAYMLYRQTLGTSRALWALLVLVTSSVFLQRAHEVRSDMLAMNLALVGWLGLLTALQKNFNSAELSQVCRTNSTQWFSIGVIALILAMLSTLKACYFVLASLPLQWAYLSQVYRARWKSQGVDGCEKNVFQSSNTRYLMLPLGIFLVLAGYFLVKSVPASLTYLINSFSKNQMEFNYYSWFRLQHILRFLASNPWFVGLVLLKVLSHIHYQKEATEGVPLVSRFKFVGFTKSIDRALSYSVLLILLFFLGHPDPLPFFVCPMLPFLTLLVFHWPGGKSLLNGFHDDHRASRENPASPFLRNLIGVALLAFNTMCLLSLFTTSRHLILNHNNREQKRLMTQIGKLLPEKSKVAIYDPVGLLPYHQVRSWYLGPGQKADNHRALERIKSLPTQIVFYTQRLNWLEPQLSQFLKHASERTNGGIYFLRQTMPLHSAASYSLEELLSKIEPLWSQYLGPQWRIHIFFHKSDDTPLPPPVLVFQDKTKAPFQTPLDWHHLMLVTEIQPQSQEWPDQMSVLILPPPSWDLNQELAQAFRFDPEL